ncbi:dihydroxy-acid dehydratase [Nocardia sp. CY41]|uniref:dihydroxy-acid dehydratase n=1 Tax=Nocardia sp. CY41 TaxID=2608686 RepID=UPI00135CE627|nr:dihydroxy-acid dehydratase [Nocardia sp. CY41]
MSQEGIQRAGGELMTGDGADALITRGLLRGAGVPSELIGDRPVIGIANTWSELNPCNGGLRDIAAHVKRGVIAAGGIPLEFPTISIGEAFTRPSSMYLRNLLAMDTEEMISSSPIDGVVLLGGCDKTLPAQIMGAVSAGKPAIGLAAGPRPLSRWAGADMSIDDLWPLLDKRRTGELNDTSWAELEACLSCGVGTCNVMGTAITMAVVAEVLGMSLPGSALLPADSPARAAIAEATGARAVAHVQRGITPSQFITPAALENAFRMICAVGGSTNAVLHLQAIAGRLGLGIDIEDMRRLSAQTPFLADVKPSGHMFLHDLQADGGVPALMGVMAPLQDLSAFAGDGRPWHESTRPMSESSKCLTSLDDPKGAPGTLAVLTGSLAPRGALLKASAATPGLCRHVGPAVVFDGVEDLRARIDDPDVLVEADSVLVLRGAGPLGGPGMPEVGHLPIPTRLLDKGVTDMVRISDARMSGTATGTVVLHVSPESEVGGPLALVRDGDLIALDVDRLGLDLLVDERELRERSRRPSPLRKKARGYDHLYRQSVLQADQGCDFDFLRADND